MKKLFLIFLILTPCCYLSTAKEDENKHYTFIFNNDNMTKVKSQEYNNLSIYFLQGSYFLQNLLYFGVQVVVGHAGDSGLLDDSYLFSANYQPISASISQGEDFNMTADVLININSRVSINSQFLVTLDPSTYNRKIISLSFEWQNSTFGSISGYNISYEADQDLYEVIPFNGLNKSLTYKTQNLSNITTTYSSQDFREKFSNWTSLNASEIYNNKTLQYGFNTALRYIRSWSEDSSLFSNDYDDSNITAMHSIDTFYVPEVADVFRYEFDFHTTNQSGRMVSVVYCAVLKPQFLSDWPSYYPELPLAVAANGNIISNSKTEAIGADGYYPNEEEEGSAEQEELSSEEFAENSQNSMTSNNSTSNATSAQPTNIPPEIFINFYCLYSELRYYWLVEFARPDNIDI